MILILKRKELHNQMKVVFTIANMAGGGSERVISILANQFVKRGIDTAILMTAGNTIEYALDSKVETVSMGGTSGGSMKKRIERISAMRQYFMQEGNKDAVLVAFGPGTAFYTWMSSLGLGNKLIISERNDPSACPHPILRNMVYNRASRLVFQTYQARDCFPKRIAQRGEVIPNPIKPNLPEPYVRERPKTVVAVGRLEDQKNYPLLIKAFSEFHKEFGEYSLHIYGKGYLEEELKRLSYNELELTDKNVIFEGFRTDVNDCIRNAGMYILSSDYEGISNALIEALAMGIPTISTDCPIGGSAMCIKDGVSGLLVPVGDATKLAEAMKKLAENEEYASLLGQKALEIRNKYDENTITENWINIIK